MMENVASKSNLALALHYNDILQIDWFYEISIIFASMYFYLKHLLVTYIICKCIIYIIFHFSGILNTTQSLKKSLHRDLRKKNTLNAEDYNEAFDEDYDKDEDNHHDITTII